MRGRRGEISASFLFFGTLLAERERTWRRLMVNAINGASIVKNLTGGTLDIQDLAKSLTEASRAPRQSQIEQRQYAAEARISSIGKIQSAAEAFKSEMNAYGDPRGLPYSPVTSNEAVARLSFKSLSNPVEVDFSFQVTQLATDNKIMFSGLVGGPFEVNLNGRQSETFASLADLQSWIKTQDGYTATIINGTDLLISRGSGVSNQFFASMAPKITFPFSMNHTQQLSPLPTTGIMTLPSIAEPILYEDLASLSIKLNESGFYSASYDPNIPDQIFLSGTGNDTGTISVQTAISSSGQDAVITTNGATYTSPQNRFSGLIPGANIDIFSVSSSDVTVSTQRNTANFVRALQSIVDGYNQLHTSLTNEMKYDIDVTKRGGLANDPIAKNLLSQMRRLTTEPITGYSDVYSSVTLADVGVRTKRDGKLELDVSRVEVVIQNDPGRLEAVLASTSSTKGAIDRMKMLTDTLTSRSSVLQQLYDRTQYKDLRAIENDKLKLEDEMSALLNRYLVQFSAMQNLVTSAQKTQDSLSSMMTAWTNGLKNG